MNLSDEQKDRLEYADYAEYIAVIQAQALESYNGNDVIEFDKWLSHQMVNLYNDNLSFWEKLST